jgi:hypothetical protein
MTAPETEHPLAWRNRRLIADRLHWPAGTALACEDLEREFPEWYPCYRLENTIEGFESPAGFYAERWQGRRGERPAYGRTAAELADALRAA